MTKIIKNSLLTVLFTLIVFTIFPTTAFAQYEARLNAPNGEAYYTRELNAYAKTGYGMPNCVAYAYGRAYELNGEAPKISKGNAGEWWFINKAHGYYEYGQEAKLGAIACWSRHVAVVEDISDDGAITISESHWGGTYFDTKVFYNMSSHYGQAFYGYIYIYDDTIPPEEYTIDESYVQSKVCFSSLNFEKPQASIISPMQRAEDINSSAFIFYIIDKYYFNLYIKYIFMLSGVIL